MKQKIVYIVLRNNFSIEFVREGDNLGNEYTFTLKRFKTLRKIAVDQNYAFYKVEDHLLVFNRKIKEERI